MASSSQTWLRQRAVSVEEGPGTKTDRGRGDCGGSGGSDGCGSDGSDSVGSINCTQRVEDIDGKVGSGQYE